METVRVAQILAGAAQGGAENFYTRLVKALATQPGVIQQAFLRNHSDRVADLRAASVAIELCRFGGRFDLAGNFRYRRALKKFQPDIVLTWMGRASIATPRSRKYTLVSRLGHYYNLKYYKHADYWIGITQGICDHMIRGGFPADRIFQIPNFADESPVQKLPRDSFATPPEKPLLLAAGRLHVNKGFDTLLQAFAGLPDATLWLAGAGPEEHSLKTLAQQLGVVERVRFLGWRDDVGALMETADVFVCPSRHEGLGSIVPESWLHRCPIVATRSQGPDELIEHGETGLLCPIDDVAMLRQMIAQALDDSALRAKLVENAAKHYRHHYSRDRITAQYIGLFNYLKEQR